eukprot:jgi/Botrbrau1/4550/Bobra.60_2s0037.1
MSLQVTATEAHVRQAIDLFKASTMDAVKAGLQDVVFTEEQKAELHAVEAKSGGGYPLGDWVRVRRFDRRAGPGGIEPHPVARTLHYLDQQQDFSYERERHFHPPRSLNWGRAPLVSGCRLPTPASTRRAKLPKMD